MKPCCGRLFTADELQTICHLIETHPGATRAQLSRQVCVLLNWLKPNGELKDMTCRVAMLRMQADGLFSLPAARGPPSPTALSRHRRDRSTALAPPASA